MKKSDLRKLSKKRKRGYTVYGEPYSIYINSAAWRKKRQEYWDSGKSNDCYVCGAPYRQGMHLHHRSYRRLGAEYLDDLVAVCESCHRDIHAEWDGRGEHLWGVTESLKKRSRDKER
jgi:5-methylcytosine-specific restriction endonuclease McrA